MDLAQLWIALNQETNDFCSLPGAFGHWTQVSKVKRHWKVRYSHRLVFAHILDGAHVGFNIAKSHITLS